METLRLGTVFWLQTQTTVGKYISPTTYVIEHNHPSFFPLYTGHSISISAQNGYIIIRLQLYYNPPVDRIM